MVYLEYRRIESKRYYSIFKNVHHCNKCSYFSRSIFLMLNHVQRHKREEKEFRCNEGGIEAYLCIQCQFRTFLTVRFIQHVKKYHSHTEEQNPFPGICYKCKDCPFETCSIAFWLKHRKDGCFKEKKRIKKNKTDRLVKLVAPNLKHEMFKCQFCPLMSKYPQVVKAHSKLHTSKSKWLVCEDCDDYMTLKTMNLIKHCHRFHNVDSGFKLKTRKNRKILQIALNLNKTKLKNVFQRNIKRGVYKDKFFCRYCPFKSKYAQVVKVHSKLHTSKLKILKCEDCNFTTRTTYLYLKHYSRSHRTKASQVIKLEPVKKEVKVEDVQISKISQKAEIKKEKPKKPLTKTKIKWFKCDNCTFKTIYAGVMKIHHIKHTSQRPHWFQCDKCHYKTDNIDHLVRHSRVHCRSMKNSFTKKANVRDNKKNSFMKEQSNVREKNSVMKKKCKKQNSSSSAHENHRKWRKCEHCEYETRILANLRRHVLTVHTDDKSVQWFKCEHCDYKAKLKGYVKRHTDIRHKSRF